MRLRSHQKLLTFLKILKKVISNIKKDYTRNNYENINNYFSTTNNVINMINTIFSDNTNNYVPKGYEKDLML